MRVSEWISLHPGCVATIPPDSQLDQVIDVMLKSAPCLRDIYVVTDGDLVIGHLSFKRLAHAYLAEHTPVYSRRHLVERIAGGTAKELMDAHFASAQSGEELDDVIHRQLVHDMEDLPVLDEEGKLLGMINMTEVLAEMRSQAI